MVFQGVYNLQEYDPPKAICAVIRIPNPKEFFRSQCGAIKWQGCAFKGRAGKEPG